MTDKEMIINGVDVSECEYHFKQFDNWIGKDVVMCDCTLGCRCEPKENHCKFYMYYLEQQLDRKEQECKNLKEELRCNRRSIKDISIESTEICKILEKYKQALDKIEEFCTVYSDNHDAYEAVYKQILDIISKSEV